MRQNLQQIAKNVITGLFIMQWISLLIGCNNVLMAPSVMTTEALKNATYHLDFLGMVKLIDGKYVKKIPKSHQEERIHFESGMEVFSDLNHDGMKDAIAILVYRSGGTGSFYSLVVLINQNDSPKHVATASLGDRVVIRSTHINSDNIISVNMLTHGPKEGLCCPTTPVIRNYRLNGTKLFELVNYNPK